MEEMIIAPQINFIVRELIKLSYFNYTFKPIGRVAFIRRYVTDLLNHMQIGSCGPISTLISSSSKI